jgi:hypothetical protein
VIKSSDRPPARLVLRDAGPCSLVVRPDLVRVAFTARVDEQDSGKAVAVLEAAFTALTRELGAALPGAAVVMRGLEWQPDGKSKTRAGGDGVPHATGHLEVPLADAQDYWRIFQRKLDSLRADTPATTETRNLWIVPLLGLLGYQLEYQQRGVELNGKTYPISHRATNRGNTPVHIIGCREPAGLDRKPERSYPGAPRMSAHALLQEYLNLHDELYGLITNGRLLRLLRDSSRLIKLSYLEFDLDRIFSDGLFADFALLYRLLHASRLPAASDQAAQSLIERYHQFGGSAPPGPPTLFPNDLPPEVWQTPKSDDPVLLEMQALAAVLKAG